MADLADLFSVDTPVWMSLENPRTFEPMTDADGNLMQVAMWSGDSETMRDVEKKISSDMLERASRSRGGRFKMDPASTERYARSRFLARIHDWRNLVVGGKPFPFNDENKAKLYDDSRFGPIRRQIEAFAGDEGNFLSTVETPSKD